MQTLSLGYSTCPNDTFIFGGLALGAVQAADITFNVTLADVEELNRWAVSGGENGRPDVCKVSVAAAAGMLDEYWLLRAGGAMGYGVGPLLVAREKMAVSALAGGTIAVPGLMTTATLLLGCMLREQRVVATCKEMIFDRIMPAVCSGAVEAGVIIHEGRFTYAQHGLVKLLDLGHWWEQSRGLPIPLGCIAIRRSLGEQTAQAVNRAICESLAYAQQKEARVWEYIKSHAREMDDTVVREHINTFVTEYSKDMGIEGQQAIMEILAEGSRGSGAELADLAVFVPNGC